MNTNTPRLSARFFIVLMVKRGRDWSHAFFNASIKWSRFCWHWQNRMEMKEHRLKWFQHFQQNSTIGWILIMHKNEQQCYRVDVIPVQENLCMCLMKIISRIRSACCNNINPVPEFTFSVCIAAKSIYFESGQQTLTFNQFSWLSSVYKYVSGPFLIHMRLLAVVLKLEFR